jgi:methyltransferase-like protein/SAM-dependent methyltransferase
MAQNTSDEMPYPASSVPQTHPVRLATIGKLFGLNPISPDRARILELGCADGSNLLPLAQSYPSTQFVGVDASSSQIEAGRKIADGAGLGNVTLQQEEIGAFAPVGDKFDYIIVHDRFSRVSAAEREKILSICREALSEHGIVYISYNAFPGWHMRGALREMVRFHVRQFPDVAQRVAQARALVKFLAESVPTENNPYGLFLKNELEIAKNASDSYVRHELLEDNNQPFYFHEFAELAGKSGLQYLGETEFSSMLATNYPPSVQEALARVGTTVVAMEQYMDFLRNRAFRQSLLVRQDAKLKRNVDASAIRDCWFSSYLRPTSAEPSLAAGQKEEFKGASGASITTDNTLVKAVLLTLSRVAPNQMSFADLIRELRVNLMGNTAVIRAPGTDTQEEAFLAQQVFVLYARGVIEMTGFPFPAIGSPGEKPVATALARYQALNCRAIANLRHISLPIDLFARHLLSLLDGTKTRAELVAAMIDKVQKNVLNVQQNGGTIKDPELLQKLLEPRLTAVLDDMGRLGLLQPA